MAFLIRAEDSLFAPVRTDKGLYEAIFKGVANRAKPFLKNITGKMLQKNIAGTGVVLVGSKNRIGLTVEVGAIDTVSQVAVVCLLFPFLGKTGEQEKVIQTIKFQAKVKDFYVNHCGLETIVSLSGLNIEEEKINNGNGAAQRYYRLKQ